MCCDPLRSLLRLLLARQHTGVAAAAQPAVRAGERAAHVTVYSASKVHSDLERKHDEKQVYAIICALFRWQSMHPAAPQVAIQALGYPRARLACRASIYIYIHPQKQSTLGSRSCYLKRDTTLHRTSTARGNEVLRNVVPTFKHQRETQDPALKPSGMMRPHV